MNDKAIKQLRKKIHRKLSKTTQLELSRNIGISRSYLSMIINGKRQPKNAADVLSKINHLIKSN